MKKGLIIFIFLATAIFLGVGPVLADNNGVCEIGSVSYCKGQEQCLSDYPGATWKACDDEFACVSEDSIPPKVKCEKMNLANGFACNCVDAGGARMRKTSTCVAQLEWCDAYCQGIDTTADSPESCMGKFCVLKDGHAVCQAESKVTEYIPPEVILEVPFGSDGTAGNPVVGLDGYVSIFYDFVVAIVAIAAVIMIMFGGFKWATAAGNSSMVASAKQTITNAIIGLVLALTSFLLLYTINPALVSIQTFKIPFVQMGGSGSGECSDIPNIANVWLYHTPNDTKMLEAGGYGTRPAGTLYCSTGSPVPGEFGGGGKVVINPKVCEAIAVAAKALANTGSTKKLCVGPIVGGHYKCSSGCAEGCNVSKHWNGDAVDIYFRPKGVRVRCGEENALTYDETIAVFNAIKSLSPSQTIACFPGNGTDGCGGTCGILPGASTIVSLQCGHDDHIHMSF